jgi:hypothetical protein
MASWWHGDQGLIQLRIMYAINCATLLPLAVGHLFRVDQGPGERVATKENTVTGCPAHLGHATNACIRADPHLMVALRAVP